MDTWGILQKKNYKQFTVFTKIYTYIRKIKSVFVLEMQRTLQNSCEFSTKKFFQFPPSMDANVKKVQWSTHLMMSENANHPFELMTVIFSCESIHWKLYTSQINLIKCKEEWKWRKKYWCIYHHWSRQKACLYCAMHFLLFNHLIGLKVFCSHMHFSVN